ncbi:hypothetical protein CXB51_017356 [Gossypium anomalum]|uniref:Aminotransferase-like plant mobile domain-containing protein n=1 Tax=Gossypium anomalum TaxID=47600 RepID=A0A8J5YFJ3_9ROSI|nr:hypothetical protein CXB51_017356 [Gossypium anomalum]
MAGELIRLDYKHISVDQMKMPYKPRVQVGPKTYQRVERWRPETHTFHLSCGERTITLEDRAICYDLLGAIPDNIYGGRIKMGWLRDTFPEPGNDSTEVERIRWGFTVLATLYQEMCGATPPNKAKIGGCLSLLQSRARFRFPFLRPRVNHPYTFLLITRWNHSVNYVGIPTALEDIRLLLDQWLEAQFQWTPYEDLVIWAVIPEEFFQNSNIWHVKVPLVNYAIVEMHQMDRVLQQFGF